MSDGSKGNLSKNFLLIKAIFSLSRAKYLTVKCPECEYVFSNKEDFSFYEVGETIQCPVCGTELKVNKDQQLEIIDLESLNDLGER